MTEVEGSVGAPARRRAWLWVGVIVALFALGIGIWRASDEPDTRDPVGDMEYIEGESPRGAAEEDVAASTADLVSAEVRGDTSEIEFTTTLAVDVPNDLPNSSLEIRFDLSEEGRDTWIVSATVNVDLTAAVVHQVGSYGSGTIDGSLPGEVIASGRTVTISLDPSEIDGFPSSFGWKSSTKLIAFRDIPGSSRVEDHFPDEGTETF